LEKSASTTAVRSHARTSRDRQLLFIVWLGENEGERLCCSTTILPRATLPRARRQLARRAAPARCSPSRRRARLCRRLPPAHRPPPPPSRAVAGGPSPRRPPRVR